MPPVTFTQGIYSCIDVALADQFKDIEPSQLFTFLRVLYRSDTGRIGFDADDTGLRLLAKILEGAVAWDYNKKQLRHFSEREDKDPYLFLASFGVPATLTNIITYHNPKADSFNATNSILRELPYLPTMDREQIYSHLLKILPICKYIVVWNMMDVGALLITEESNKVITWLQDECTKAALKYYDVESVNHLPEW